MIYKVRDGYARQFYAYAGISAALVPIVALVPWCPSESPAWRWSVAVFFLAGAAFLVWYARRLSRTSFEITPQQVVERSGKQETVSILWENITAVEYVEGFGFIQVRRRSGPPLGVPVQLEHIDAFVAELEQRSGRQIVPGKVSWRAV